jgi:hypothetical protein
VESDEVVAAELERSRRCGNRSADVPLTAAALHLVSYRYRFVARR